MKIQIEALDKISPIHQKDLNTRKVIVSSKVTYKLGRGTLVLMLVALSISGCSSLRLHSDTREKQGLAAKEAWSLVDTTSVFSSETTNLKSLLTKELETQEKLALSVRNFYIRAVLEKSVSSGIQEEIKNRLVKTIGSTATLTQTLEKANEEAEKLNNYNKSLSDHKNTWRYLNLNNPFPTCGKDEGGTISLLDTLLTRPGITPGEHGAIEALFEGIQRLCKSVKPVKTQMYAGFGGEISLEMGINNKKREVLEGAKKAFEIRKEKYNIALQAYERAAAITSQIDTSSKVSDAVQKLGETVDELKKNAGPLFNEFLGTERITALDKFISDVALSTSEQKIHEGSSRLAASLKLFPDLIDDAKQSLQNAQAPLAMPFLIRRNQEQIQLALARQEVEFSQKEIQFSDEILETLYQQVTQLDQASKTLSNYASNTATLSTILSTSSSDVKEELYMAVLRYLDVLGRLDSRRYQLEYERLALQNELKLKLAEANIKQWTSLISAIVEQSTAYTAGGIKKESVPSLINAFWILLIANGVFK